MGNNNSSYNNGHIKSRHLHHDYRGHGKWATSSDLGEQQSGNNRMKKGYLPTRGYHGAQRLPSPHKVLPSVNPTSAAKLLKPTSNGAILHQGGTISGRKLLSELDPHSPEAEDLRRAMRKRSTASCPNGDMILPASGRSTPNLSVMEYNGMMERNGPRRASSKGGSSSRDYDSEPDLRDVDDNHRDDSSPQRSISPVPNSFTLIQESPAKKQIRSKKKGKAPPPPVVGERDHHIRIGGDMSCCSQNSPQLLSPCGESKKVSRLFKTKAESRHAANGPRSPEICSDLEMSRGGMMRASMDANRFFRGDRDRSSVHSIEAGLCTSKPSAVNHTNLHLSSRKHSEGGLRKASLSSTTAVVGSNSGGGLSSRNNPEVKNMNMAPLARDHASASVTKSAGGSSNASAGGNRPAPTSSSSNNNSTSNIIMINHSGTTKDEHVPKTHRVSSTNLIPPIAPYGQSSQSAANSSNSANPSVNQKGNKGFISSSSSQTKAPLSNNAPQNNHGKPNTSLSNGKVGSTSTAHNNVHHGRRKSTNAPAAPNTVTTSATNKSKSVNSNNDSSNKTKFYFGMDSHPSTNNKHQTSAMVHQSDSDNNNNECRRENERERLIMNHHEKVSSTNSELLQIKQDSGSFDITERQTGDGVVQGPHRESSSELSSSDLDIPLNIRPTLPAKKLGLPRFSPTAAWRALDSPSRVSVSGRSYSSEEGYGHDRIQRYMRQIPPSRANNNHERSAGDSGISAGDAGSPANPELIAEASAATTPSTNNPMPAMNVGRGYKFRDRGSSGKHLRDSEGNKCWTPEQDLDESSSSEFEDQPMSPHHHPPHPAHSGSNIATRVLPAGLSTPPKLTTRNNLFQGGRGSALGMVSDSDQYHSEKPGNLYVRSRKAGMLNNNGSSAGVAGGKSPNGQQTHDDIKKSQIGASRYYRNIRSQPWKQANHLRQTGGNNNANGSREFVGLDTNWFLSRSEPNSLNLIGNGEYDNIEQQELRLVLAEQDDDEDDDYVGGEEELYLPAEDNNKKAMNMHDVDHVVNNEYDIVDGGTRLESEIGYGPSSMSFSSPLPSPSAVNIKSRSHANRRKEQASNVVEEFERDQDIEMASPNSSNVRYGDKPFSHIMYLPAYDSRRTPSSVTRRTKSVDNLNFTEMTVHQPRKTSQYNNPISPNVGNSNHHHRQRRSRSPSDSGHGRRIIKRGEEEPFERSQSVPPFTAEEENERRRKNQIDQQAAKLQLQQQQQREQAEREREQKKKKFKFQSTLRVLERKKIEEQLSREAEEKERRRLQEQEQMRKVEEEFQRKRVREKVLEMEAAAAKANQSNNNVGKNGGHNFDKADLGNHNRYDVSFEPRNANSGGVERNNQHNRGNSGRSSNISYSSNQHLMYARQEPEGAPASTPNGPTGDLRKELICASRHRSGFPGSTKHSSELTQELSEFCTPTGQRQYFDYRRAHEGDGLNVRTSSGPTTRYYNSSSSSDIFPVTSRRERKRGGGSSVISSSKSSVGYLRPTVHPQVVCDIPVKRLPYVVNFSRLSSSNMDLLTEQDRPRSGMGGNASVLSDNYRKDWAHHNSKGNGPVRASSVISLHSAPPLSNSENFRHSSVDLTAGSVLHTPPQSPRQSTYSTSPSASPVSHTRPLSSPEERFQANNNNDIPPSKSRTSGVPQERWDGGDCVTGNKTVVMLNSPPTVLSSSPSLYQPAPYNRQKNFRPVDFQPSSGGLSSPAHAFHHASAKLTTPTPVN
ncbi:unnamed protein product [Orchesella dallaii]|uniref:Uncharacterized protein n=1 Tax=Orchesella dallaii TaxID=48710 RepID=A0ABP1QSK8_9HEXA